MIPHQQISIQKAHWGYSLRAVQKAHWGYSLRAFQKGERLNGRARVLEICWCGVINFADYVSLFLCLHTRIHSDTHIYREHCKSKQNSNKTSSKNQKTNKTHEPAKCILNLVQNSRENQKSLKKPKYFQRLGGWAAWSASPLISIFIFVFFVF